ncbi:zinc finger protein 1035 isoform X1 [Phyllopteryx taeniolatus]|uniref:zinc finger protein 1035 isoform X1 n=2 Tax=Phyllopteryx taeniolatus TaxID=161469 RepID=UPI002AD3C8CF|nr:zinc finger protein 1035 isoform X1 [Phyllopteryx taeniolatus]XP_061631941.1 zinc finger protein 1035 isoform X1 [Phyllopteryx taeniolatus]XP_061631942.1 zinc finger protein 1035 isoform X1 [Phyllopteryx taeniolatus]XP_061631943.1 zinc finger protein 1035 isoform X1 [Phyllopteryx taeniolatus]
MAHEWDSYFQNLTPLSSDPKTLRTSEPEGSLAQHIETFVGQHEFSNSTASDSAPATDSTFDTKYYSTSNVGNSASDCSYESFYRETPWQADEGLMLKDTSLRCENADIKDLAMNGLSSSGPSPSSYSAELQGLQQNCELLASSLLEDYSDVSSCSDTEVNETRPSCKFITSPTRQPKPDSTTKQSPSDWLFTHPENVTFSNEINAICPGSPKLMTGGNIDECIQGTNKGFEENGSCNTVHNQSFSGISTRESGTIEDCNEKEGLPIQEQEQNVDHYQIEGYYSDISVSDNENLTGIEDHPDHMEEHRTVTPEYTKMPIAKMEDEDNGLERATEETKESCLLENDVNDSPNVIGQQKINMTHGEEACSAVRQREEKEFDSLGEETFNVPKQTNIEFSSVHDESMEIDNPLSDMEINFQDNEMNTDTPQISDPPESESNNALRELVECTNMLETNREDIGSCLQFSKSQPSQSVVLDNICCPVPMSDGNLSNASAKKSLCSNSYYSLNTNNPRTDSDLVSDDLGSGNNKQDVDIISDWQQQPCSRTETNICEEEEIKCFQEENQTSSKSSDCTGVTIDACILDVHVENKQSISNDLKSFSQKSDLNNDCDSYKDKDPAENTPQCPENILHQNPVCPEQELTQCIDENVRVLFEGMDTSEEEKLMLGEQYGEPPVAKHSSDTDSMKPEESKCIVQSKGNRLDESEEQGSALKSSLQMRKRLQPVVIMNKMEPAPSVLYQCALCQQITHSVDHLIEHHHCQHSDQIFQFCKTSNKYLISNEQSHKHVGNNTEEPQLASDSSHRKRKSHHCSRCNMTFSKIILYVQHMRGHTGVTPYKCDGCGLYFAQNCTLKRHKNKPGRCRNFKPENPDAKSSDHEVIKLVKHETTPPSPPQNVVMDRRPLESLSQCYVNLFDVCKTNVCVYCGKQYSTPRKVKKHIYNMHKGNPPGVWQNHTTMKLTKKTNEKTLKISLEKTENIENETRGKYKCALCPRIFMQSYNRARHLRDCVRLAVSRNKGKVGNKYRCPLCHATFTQPGNRYRHIKTFCLRKTHNQLLKENAESEQRVELNIKKELKRMGQKKVAMENKQTESNSTTPTTITYKCGVCPAVFHQVSGLYQHVKRHESKITGKMIKYKTSVLSRKSNIKPLRTKTKQTEQTEDILKTDEKANVSLSCRYCEKKCDTEQSLKNHERCHRGERPYRCLDCRRGFKKRVYLMAHKVVHQSIQCTLCRKILPNARNLVQHAKLHHKGKMFPCPNCQKQFLSPMELLRHLKLHQKEGQAPLLNGETLKSLNSVQAPGELKELQCSLCNEVFDDGHLLRKHSLTHISSCQCPYCDQKFKARRYLLLHMFKHTGEKPYSCTQCGKSFYHKPSLETHKEMCVPTQNPEHSQPKNHECSICSRTFKKKVHLMAHKNGHKNNTLRVCTNCGMFFGLSKFGLHRRTCGEISQPNNILSSNGDACQNIPQKSQTVTKTTSQSSASRMLPFKCPNCTRRFRFRSLLLKHSVSHTGVQPYACIHCGERFSSNLLQLQHEEHCNDVSKEEESKVNEASIELTKMPACMEEEPISLEKAGDEYKCKFCTKTFVKPRSLRRHILTHNEVNPYRCKACGSCFSRYDYLKVHHAQCKGKRLRLQICIPKISLDDVGKGWQNRLAIKPMKQQERFDCKVCSKSFPTQSGVSRHVTLFHTVKLFRCPHCDTEFTHEKSLNYHMKHKNCKKVSKKQDSTPPQDNLPSGNVKPLQEEKATHQLQLYSNKKHKYTCIYCPRAFANSARLRIHTRLHTGEKPFSCDCGLRFIRNDYLKRHCLKCTVKLCKTCGVAFPQKELYDHQKTCTSTSCQSMKREETSQSLTKGFSCAYCSLRFSLFSQLQEHFLNAHKLEMMDPPASLAPLQHHLSKLPPIKDDGRDKQPGEGSNLTCKLDTTLVGDVSESLVCPVCNLSFENKAGLKGHSRMHSKEIPFKCKTCKKGFWNKNLLRNHNRKCRFGNVNARDPAQKLEGPQKADLNLTLPSSVLVFKDESQTDSGVLQRTFSCKDHLEESPQNPNEDQIQSSANKDKKVVQYQCSECDLSFTDGLMLISHLEDHGREEQANKCIPCTKCKNVFSSQADLEKHMRSHGLSKNFSCSGCTKSFYTLSELEIHKTYHDLNRPFACKLCSHRFWSRQSLGYHYTEEHSEHTSACRFCKKTYATKKSLQRHCRKWHLKEQKNSESSLEQKPNVACQSSEDESNSSEDSDSAPYFPCHVCGKTFPTSENLEDHQKCHLGEKPHECAECGRCFFQASQLEQHKRMHKSELQCQVCGRGFVSLFALRKHKHSHGKSRPHRCSRCQLSFSGASQLAEHMSTHREENFPCDICNKVFPSKSSRAEHRKEHTSSERPSCFPEKSTLSESYPEKLKNLKYRCGLCYECFKDPEDLSEHGCKASKERLYSCSGCDKHFLHLSHLKQHRVIHQKSTTDSEYSCSRCNTTSSSIEQFLSHVKTHKNELIGTGKNADGYRCPICSECFVKATELISHIPVHSENMLKCEMCKISFSTKNELEEHEQRHHSSVSEFECKGCDKRFLGSDAFHKHACSPKRQEMVVPAEKSGAETNHQDAAEEEEIDVTGEELYNCSTCAMQFSSKSILLEHQNKVHLNEKPFKCKHCARSFAFSHTLQRHELGVHMKQAQPAPESQLKCPQCSSKFNTAQELSLHMRMHAERQVGQHRCDMCYKSFAHSTQLLRHQESHVGQIVYECTECDKAFAFPHLLEEHQQTHA